MKRLALAVFPSLGLPVLDLPRAAREAEEAGLEAVFTTEAGEDTLGCVHLMAHATQRIKVGSWIANIYLRHPYLCACAARLIAEVSQGRLILGLGVSHRPANEALGIEMGRPIQDMREYATRVAGYLRGEGAALVPPRPAPKPVPLYLAALALKMAELAGEVADGVMLYLCPPNRIERVKKAAAKGREVAKRSDPVDITLGIPVFLDESLESARAKARAGLAFYTVLPFYQALFRDCGFEEEARAMAAGKGMDAISERLIDAVTLAGPPQRCREGLERFRQAGVDLPILVAPAGVPDPLGAIRAMIEALAS